MSLIAHVAAVIDLPQIARDYDPPSSRCCYRTGSRGCAMREGLPPMPESGAHPVHKVSLGDELEQIASRRREMPAVRVERTTSSRVPTGRRACWISSRGGRSSSCSTSCSTQPGTRAVRFAPTKPTAAVTWATCMPVIRRWRRYPGRRSARSSHSVSGWAGHSPGTRRTRATTTSRRLSTRVSRPSSTTSGLRRSWSTWVRAGLPSPASMEASASSSGTATPSCERGRATAQSPTCSAGPTSSST